MPRGYKGVVVTAAEASRRWKERNPDRVKEAGKRRGPRKYSPEKSKEWRRRRLLAQGYRQKVNATANRRAITLRRWLDARKIETGCVDCGYRAHPAALHFDHVQGPKLLNVCTAKSIAQARAEMVKCEVRCANCHAIRTFERLRAR